MTSIKALLAAKLKYSKDEQLNYFGKEMFRMYTELGFPPDMFMGELAKKKIEATGEELELLEKVYIISIYQSEFLEHRRKAGIQDKNLPRLRQRNLEQITNIINGKELGVY